MRTLSLIVAGLAIGVVFCVGAVIHAQRTLPTDLVLGQPVAGGASRLQNAKVVTGYLDLNALPLYFDRGGDDDSYLQKQGAGDAAEFVIGGVTALRIQETASDDKIDARAFRVMSATSVLNLGTKASTTHSLSANADTLNGGKLEVDGDFFADSKIYGPSIQQDVGATCTTGEIAFDTGGATIEWCYCQATNTWYCTAVTAGVTD